jgi:hypothetical protein
MILSFHGDSLLMSVLLLGADTSGSLLFKPLSAVKYYHSLDVLTVYTFIHGNEYTVIHI